MISQISPHRPPSNRPMGFRGAARSIYDRIAGSNDYQRNERSLRFIQICVVTVSAIATGFVNAFAHVDRLGWFWAGVLAILITAFVEKFYFTVRHGLTTVYKAGKQRLYASLCYRLIQLTMILNAAILCAWIVGFGVPDWLQWWNHWSIVCHFALALIGVSAVRDADAVVENRVLELKAETARQDLVTTRKAAAIGSAMVLLAAKLRGHMDATWLALRLMMRKPPVSAKDYLDQVDEISKSEYGHIDGRAGLAYLDGQEPSQLGPGTPRQLSSPRPK